MNFTLPFVLDVFPLESDFPDFSGYSLKIVYRRAVLIYWRSRLSEAQNHRCCWCGCRMADEIGKKTSPSVEHVEPKSKGGKNHPDNYAVACQRCNTKRGDLDVEVYLERIAEGRRTPAERQRIKREKQKNRRFEKLHQDNRIVFG